MSPYRMVKEIRDFLPRDAISVLDGNIIMAVAQEVLPCYLIYPYRDSRQVPTAALGFVFHLLLVPNLVILIVLLSSFAVMPPLDSARWKWKQQSDTVYRS